ncbi:MAG: FAD-dependent oxidoreductase, partial [Bacteroidota bacterium]
MPETIDFLIVGQGLAGTLVTAELERRGQSVRVVDNNYPRAASKVAAGIMNPVTGRRYVKSWKYPDLYQQAEFTYRRLEQQLGVSFFHPRRILRTLFNQREQNDWDLRATDAAYQDYLLPTVDLGNYAAHTVPAFAYGEVQNAAQVDLRTLLEAYRKYLSKDGRLMEMDFSYTDLQLGEELHYQNVTARNIVFCEGHGARQNPWFGHLPFGGAKGEVLIVRLPETSFEKLLKHRIFIVPLADGTYWIGSVYEWNYEDDGPTESGRTFLVDRLDELLTTPYEILDHRAAIRPTVKDRRPFLGVHPEHSNLFLFNGLGTKGASLGPLHARQLV